MLHFRGMIFSILGPVQGFTDNFYALAETHSLGSIRAGICVVIEGRNSRKLGEIYWRDIWVFWQWVDYCSFSGRKKGVTHRFGDTCDLWF